MKQNMLYFGFNVDAMTASRKTSHRSITIEEVREMLGDGSKQSKSKIYLCDRDALEEINSKIGLSPGLGFASSSRLVYLKKGDQYLQFKKMGNDGEYEFTLHELI